MNEKLAEQAQLLKDGIKLEKSLLKEHVHKSLTRLQPEVDRLTTLIYKHLQVELDEIKTSYPSYKIAICPSAYFAADDIGPHYHNNVDVFYHLVVINNDAIMDIFSLSNKESDLTFDSIRDKILELESIGINIKTILNKDDTERISVINKLMRDSHEK